MATYLEATLTSRGNVCIKYHFETFFSVIKWIGQVGYLKYNSVLGPARLAPHKISSINLKRTGSCSSHANHKNLDYFPLLALNLSRQI